MKKMVLACNWHCTFAH